MKKTIIILTILILCLTGCNKEEQKTDAILFKEEYEALNGKKNEQNEPYTHVSIPEDNAIVYSNMTQILALFSGGTGVVYLGTSDDQQSRKIVPILLSTANMVGLETIYYYDVKQKNQSKDLEQLFSLLSSSETNMIYPTVLFIKEGTLLKSILGMNQQIFDPNLSKEEEEKKLVELYSTSMHELLGDVCDQNCE